MNNKKEKLKLIEEYGLFLEKYGYTPSAGRVYALLLIWEPEELHFDEVKEILNLSKGAASKSLNQLMDLNRVEIMTKPGIRKKFYRVKMTPGKESIVPFISYITSLKDFMKRIVDSKEFDSELKIRLEESEEFLNFLGNKLEESVRKWDKE